MNRLFQFGGLLLVSLVLASFMPNDNTPVLEGGDAVKWYSWEEAVAANKRKRRKSLLMCTLIGVDGVKEWMQPLSLILLLPNI